MKDGKLLKEAFKAIIGDLKWKKAPRTGGIGSGVFYLGRLETEEKIIEVKVRPDMEMSVQETFKRCDINGIPVDKSYTKRTCQSGGSIEVRISQEFLDKLLEQITLEDNHKKREIMEW